MAASSISTPGATTLELPDSSRWHTTTVRRDFRVTSSRGSRPYGAKASRQRRRHVGAEHLRGLKVDLIFGREGVNERSSSLRSRLTDAGQQPAHYLPVRIATGRDSLHRLLSEGLSLLFGLSLVLRKRHPFADDFAARLVFRLHIKILWPRRWPAAA